MFAPPMSILANTGILSRMVLKSRASTVPVIIKLVTVLNSVEVRAETKPPAVTFTFFETCAFTSKVIHTLKKSKNVRFIYSVFK
jgi:hypothetical protein